MAAFNDHEAGNKHDESNEDGHLIVGAFDYTEEVESPFIESQFENLDADTEKLDIPNFVGDLRALMVDDSDNEVALDSDDEAISEQKQGKIRGRLWRRARAVGTQSSEIHSSAGSNMTDKVTHKGPKSVLYDSHHQEVLVVRSLEGEPISNNENVAKVDHDQYSPKGDGFITLKATFNNIDNAKGSINESQEPGESSEAKALEFVDHFVSVSAVNLSPEPKFTRIDVLRSPLTCCAKGSQNLAMKTNLMNQIGVSMFDWDNDQPDHGGEFFSRNKKELSVQRDKEGFQGSVLVNSRRTFSSSMVQNFNPMSTVLRSEETERDALCVSEFDEELSKKQLEGSNETDAPDMLDVVFDTQMAAEAMETLLHDTRFINQSHQMSTPFNKNSKNNKRLHESSLKIVSQKKRKEDSDKENIRNGLVKTDNSDSITRMQQVKTFSPVACRTRRGTLVKSLKSTDDAKCNLGFIAHGKRKTEDLDTNLLLGKRTKRPRRTNATTTSVQLKFDTRKWPKKKRTCRNTRRNAKFTNAFREDFLTSSVNRKARSASRYKSMSGKKLLMLKFGQPSLADVKAMPMNIKATPETLDESEKFQFRNLIDVGFIPSLGGEKKIEDLLLNGKTSSESNQDHVGPIISAGNRNRKQLCKKSSTSSSLQYELNRLGLAESRPDSIPKDLRRRRSKVEICVLFSQSLNDDVVKQQRKIVKKLGTSLAIDCLDATHFVADRFARTKKMLEAIAFGKPVVTPLWLDSCEQAGCIIDEKQYILRDAKKEKEIGFRMPDSLSHARTNPLLKDRSVLITSNVEPSREMIKNLVKAVQGQVMESIQQASMAYKISDNLLILSCEQDYEVCVPFLDKGAAVYSSELLLNGIIIQKLEYMKHQLFNSHVIMKRYVRKQKKAVSQHLYVARGG